MKSLVNIICIILLILKLFRNNFCRVGSFILDTLHCLRIYRTEYRRPLTPTAKAVTSVNISSVSPDIQDINNNNSCLLLSQQSAVSTVRGIFNIPSCQLARHNRLINICLIVSLCSHSVMVRRSFLSILSVLSFSHNQSSPLEKLSYAIKTQLKAPKALGGVLHICLSLCLYGIKGRPIIDPFRAFKPLLCPINQ